MIYLTISSGPSAALARPVLASTDRDVIRGAVRAIFTKIDDPGEVPATGVFPRLVAETEVRG